VTEQEQLERDLVAVQASIEQSNQRFVEMMDANERSVRIRDAAAHMDKLRQIFHRNELPRVVSYTNLEDMQEKINETLELFDAPFRVYPTEGLGFEAHFGDGRRIVDRRLSVGERIVLAIAIRITINSTFANELGVLIMDEPTAGLDEHNLGCLPQALEQLRVLSESQGMQVLFVTHEPRISHLFDTTIDLTNAH
jgi:DNA repair exonuclease SbcCD ATPase subunit